MKNQGLFVVVVKFMMTMPTKKREKQDCSIMVKPMYHKSTELNLGAKMIGTAYLYKRKYRPIAVP